MISLVADHHRLPATSDIGDEQYNENGVEERRSHHGLRAEVKITVNQVDGISANQYSPAAGVGSMTIDDCDKSERGNIQASGQRPGAVKRSATIQIATYPMIL